MAGSTQTLRGITRLGFDSVAGIVRTVEQMHETIARHPLPFSPRPTATTRAHGLIASTVYSVIRGITGAARESVDLSLSVLPQGDSTTPLSQKESAWLAALNGICGDHLEQTANPLAIQMGFSTPDDRVETTQESLTAAFPEAGSHIVVFVHGLCLSDFSWRRDGSDSIGDRLSEELGSTPVYLRYNTGRHISTNGRELAEQLDRLCAAWPAPIESLSLAGHSMGGLVIRSACHYASEAKRRWLSHLRRIVCLGTPHHGAALEKAGSLFDRAVQAIQYVEPLMFGRQRSAGIKDLRHGNLLDEDWEVEDAAGPLQDSRRHVPLLDGVDYFFVAATVGRHRYDPKSLVLGDFLVRLGSATGAHHDELRRLHIQPENCRVFHEMNHFDLLSDERVRSQLVRWFSV